MINMKLILIFTFLTTVTCDLEKESATNSINSDFFKSILDTSKNISNLWKYIKDLPPTIVDLLVYLKDPESNQLPLYLRQNVPNTQRHSSYDFIVDLTRPTDIFQGLKAYPVQFPQGKEEYDQKMNDDKQNSNRFVVNVVGRYNVGKTYVLKLLANINLGHSFTERTNGISVSLPSLADTHNAPMALIDTAGTRTPVVFDSELFSNRAYERQVSDSFIQEIAFNSADIFVLIVNQLTLDDQLYLKGLYKRLQDKNFKQQDIKQQLLLVHNYFNLNSISEVERVAQSELVEMFNAKEQFQGYWLSKDFKHFILANSDSEAGKKYNNRTIEQLQTMIKGSNAGLERDVLKKIIKETEKLLSKFLIEQPAISNKADENVDPNLFESAASFFKQSASNVLRLFFDPKHQNENLQIEPIRRVNIKLELQKWDLDIDQKIPIWFICPQESLAENITLSNNLKFNQDGSVYIDYSSDFIPDLHVGQLNEQGDIQIRIECPSCSSKYKIHARGTSLVISSEKIVESTLKDYINTRRLGKFELEVPIGSFEAERTFNFKGITSDFKDGIIRITVPVIEDVIIIGEEL